MRSLLSLLLLAAPVIAADQVPPPQPPPAPQAGLPAPDANAATKSVAPTAPAAPGAPGMQPGGPGRITPEVMAELREVEGQWRAIRDKVEADPELIKLKKAQEDAQKAYREKQEALMQADPSYAAVKAKREELRSKMMPPRPPMQVPPPAARPVEVAPAKKPDAPLKP